jgi:1-phosphofructokinase family hexose kinase
MSRTLILALNPALDVEWRVDAIRVEEKNSIHAEARWAGGKGVNVARWLRFLGGKPQLLIPLGGAVGRELAQCLRRERLSARIIPLREATRANVVITAPDGRQMRFNQAGPRLSRSEWNTVLKVVRQNLPRCELLVLSGSLARGVPATAYGQLIRLARRHGVRTLLDCDGPAFAAAVKARPFLVKPNEHELAQWWGKSLRSEIAVRRAAMALSTITRGWVFVSRGANAGLLVNQREAVLLQARPPRVTPRNRLGAGDALLAGAVRQIESGASPAVWLREGLATGAAATQCVAGALPAAPPPRRRAS